MVSRSTQLGDATPSCADPDTLNAAAACQAPSVADTAADVPAAINVVAIRVPSDQRSCRRPGPPPQPVGTRSSSPGRAQCLRRRCVVERLRDANLGRVSFHKLSETVASQSALIRPMRGFGGPERATSPFALMYPPTVQTTGARKPLRGQPVGPLLSESWDRGSSTRG